jgi:hypothetical protein
MPSLTHEALLELFRNRPTLAAEILRGVLPAVAPSCRVEIADSNLTASVPVERTADLVLLFDTTPRLVVIVEIQLAIDVGKPRAWFWYLANVAARHQSAACLVVVCPNRRVARWASEPFATGHPGLTFSPLVIGPAQIPVIRDAEVAKSNPELAVLSAVVHGRTDAAEEVGRAVFAAVAPLDDARSVLYLDVVAVSLAAAARKILEELMANGNYEYQSDFAKRYFGAGKAEGEARGRSEGRAEGEARGRAADILRILELNGVEVPASTRERILASTDLAQLDTWFARAVHAKSAAEVTEG